MIVVGSNPISRSSAECDPWSDDSVPSTQDRSLAIHIPLVFASSPMKRNPGAKIHHGVAIHHGAEIQHAAGFNGAKMLVVPRNRLSYLTWRRDFTWTWVTAVPGGARPGKIRLGKIAGFSSIQLDPPCSARVMTLAVG